MIFNFYKTFVRATGKPFAVAQTFFAQPGTQYVMTIVNGGSGSKHVSSATITLNGIDIVGPSDFNQNTSAFKIPVTVLKSNTLSVRLASAPGAQITIGIGPQ